jgi:hypothetical protein
MTGVIDSWHEKLKPNEPPPKLEEIVAVGLPIAVYGLGE